MNEILNNEQTATLLLHSLIAVAILSQTIVVLLAIIAVVYRGRAAASAAEAKCLQRWLNELLDGPQDSGWENEALFWRKANYPHVVDSSATGSEKQDD